MFSLLVIAGLICSCSGDQESDSNEGELSPEETAVLDDESNSLENLWDNAVDQVGEVSKLMDEVAIKLERN
jgi:hypothetical protein